MLPSIEKIENSKSGFTLIELLVAVAIVGIISIISLRSLYQSVLVRSKQYSIEDSSENFRSLVKLITKAIVEAQSVSVEDSHTLKVVGESFCQTLKFDEVSHAVLLAKSDTPCSSPDAGFLSMTNPGITISELTFTPVSAEPGIVTIILEGIYQDSLGSHNFRYSTSITPRVSI